MSVTDSAAETDAKQATTSASPPAVTPDAAQPRPDRRRLHFSLGCAAGLVVLTWLQRHLIPATGLEQGWMLGLNLSKQAGLTHGSELMFTYGPLGWMAWPKAFDGPTVWAYIALNTVAIGSLSFAVLYTLAARLKWWIAASATYVLMATLAATFFSEMMMLTAFALAVLVLQGAISGRLALWMPVIIAVAGGAMVSIKSGTGVVTLGVGAFLAVFGATGLSDGARRALATLAAGIGVLVVVWMATGQSVGSLYEYLTFASDLTTEYVEMAQSRVDLAWQWVAALGLSATIAIALVRASPARLHSLAAWGLAILLGLMMWHMFRYAFIRHASARFSLFCWFIALCALIIQWRSRFRYLPLVISASALLIMAASLDQPVARMIDPSNNIRGFFTDVQMALSAEARDQALEEALEAAREEYDAPDEVLTALSDGSTHIDSYQTTFAWAYEIDWEPTPVFQTYSAYSEALDQLNADKLADPQGPRHVLRRAESPIDTRYRLYESPRYTYEILCRYANEAQADTWQVVERIPESRCGDPRTLGSVEIVPGESTPVPQPSTPDALVFAQIEVERTLQYSLVRRLFKPPATSIVLDSRYFRVVANHLPGPLVLSIPDWDELPMRTLGIDGSDVRRLGIDGGGIRHIRIEFFEVPLKRAAA